MVLWPIGIIIIPLLQRGSKIYFPYSIPLPSPVKRDAPCPPLRSEEQIYYINIFEFDFIIWFDKATSYKWKQIFKKPLVRMWRKGTQ